MQRDKDGVKAQRRSIRILTGVILVILLLAFSSVFYKQNHKFAYADYLDKEVITFEGEKILLREFGYYVFEVESFTQKQALKYHPSDPLDYWNTHFSAGMNSRFVSEMARQTAVDTCLGDLVYAAMAGEEGFSLDEEKVRDAKKEASDWYDRLSKDQRETLGISKEIVTKVVLRRHLAEEYAYEYSGKADLTGYSGDVTQLLSGGGEYFKDKLQSRYDVKLNEELIEELSFGRITVNK
ncbi:MAG: hypothetical protein K6E84_01465 [Lachnospiraceae bacterium]|nr:hypothetical protein [Lachnospiraceae bacterium]